MSNKIKITLNDSNNKFYFDIKKITHIYKILKHQIKEGNNIEIIIKKAR